MPTYEYRCDACGHEFELFQQITAPVKRKCPECGKARLVRLIGTGAGVIFKGSGFYETDYRSDSYKKAAEADKKAVEPTKESKPTAQADSTPSASDASAESNTVASKSPKKPAARRAAKPKRQR